MPGTFSRHPLHDKPLVSDHGMHHGTCVTHVPWCMSGLLTRGGGETVHGIPGACATCNITYLAKRPIALSVFQKSGKGNHSSEWLAAEHNKRYYTIYIYIYITWFNTYVRLINQVTKYTPQKQWPSTLHSSTRKQLPQHSTAIIFLNPTQGGEIFSYRVTVTYYITGH